MNSMRALAIIGIVFATVFVLGAIVTEGTRPAQSPQTQLPAAAGYDSPVMTTQAVPASGQATQGPRIASAMTCEPGTPSSARGCTQPALIASTPTPTLRPLPGGGCVVSPPPQVIAGGDAGNKAKIIARSGGSGGCGGPARPAGSAATSPAPAYVCQTSLPTSTSWVVVSSQTGLIRPVGVGTGGCQRLQPGALPPTPTPTLGPGQPCTALPGWTTQGQQLRAGKKAAFDDKPGYAQLPGNNAGDYAYPSQPMDIPGPGTYAFDFGPLDQDQFVNSPLPGSHTDPTAPGIELYFPPDNYPHNFTFTAEPSIVVKNGARYIRQVIEIDDGMRPCTQLVVWLT